MSTCDWIEICCAFLFAFFSQFFLSVLRFVISIKSGLASSFEHFSIPAESGLAQDQLHTLLSAQGPMDVRLGRAVFFFLLLYGKLVNR